MSEAGKNNENKGLIFNIQRYSIHDGPGIRTTVFLKGCPLSCFWCQNPESQEMKAEILFDKSKCAYCGQCVTACPAEVNLLTPEGVKINRTKCIGCGECADACSNEARRLVGEYITVEEVIEEILKDRMFYENSGGGVTLSGGEPSMQADFALQLLRRSKEEGLHTALDTCGYISWQTLNKLVDYTDLVLFDIKCLDATKHHKATGKTNELIIKNAKKIAGLKEMWVRIPLVPGFNDSENEIREISSFVKKEVSPLKIELNCYNRLGEGKYARLDRAGIHLDPQSEEYMEKLREIVVSA